MAHDRVTTLGSGVDDAVLRISTTYDIRGLVEKLTSYDNATVGSGSVVNEIVSEYDDLGLVSKEYQEHEGAKDANTLYVQYNRDTTASSGEYTKGLRLTSVKYPNARLVHSTYSTSGSTPDAMSRLDAIEDDDSGSPGDNLAEYSYMGTGSVVEVDYPEPDLRYDLDHGTAGDYDGLDRFDRMVNLLWYDYGSSADAVRIGHGYDRAGNRLYREDSVADANSVDVDEYYSYDEMNQLVNLDRGDLNANKDGLTGGTLEFAEEWSLDMTGNSSTFKQDDDGDASWDLNQARDHNKANEIDEIDSSSTHVAHDKAGNMTKTPKPDNWSAHYDLTYDAWHRLVKVEDGENTVAEYVYDARNFRTEKKTYSGGQLDETRHFYCNSDWQCLEERIESGGSISANADQQYVWGPRYIDDLILRDRDTTDPKNGTLDERLYALQDPNWNVVALSSTDGTINERYTYQAYGEVNVLTPTFTTRASSSYDWQTFYTGRRLDVETGLMYYRNRYYHPTTGRFINRDPIGYRGSQWNLYEYVGSQPLILLDPSGKSTLIGCFKSPGLMAACFQSGAFKTADFVKHICSDKKKAGKNLMKWFTKKSWGGKIVKGGKGSHTKVSTPWGVVPVPQCPAYGTCAALAKQALQWAMTQ